MSREKSTSETFSELIQFKVTPTMRDKIVKLASADKRKVADFVRVTVEKAIK